MMVSLRRVRSPSLDVYNAFRVATVGVLVAMSLLRGGDSQPLVSGGNALYGWAAGYLVAIAASFGLGRSRLAQPLQLTLAVATDVSMLTGLIALNGGVRSGYGVLLLPFLAISGLLSSGRHALFYAALATVALLGYTGYELVRDLATPAELFQSGLLALAGFVVSVVTYQLGRVARESEALAQRQGNEIVQLNRLNALVLETLREAVLVLDDQGQVCQFNHVAANFLPELGRGQRRPELVALVERWQRSPDPSANLAVERLVRGRQLVGELIPIVQDNNRRLVLFLRDQADQAEEARRVKLAALGRLTANIAHEIRNPLAAISHAGELLAETADDAGSARLTRIVRDNALRIDTLVEEVLALNRRDRLRPEAIALAPFLTGLVDEFGVAQPDAAGAIVVEVPDTPVAVAFDRGHLTQILFNLLRNAWRHGSRQTGAVRLRVEAEPDRAHLSVLDNGPGVSEDAQLHLFEPFFTTDSQGTGLGLYIARELAEANEAWLDYVPPSGHFRLTCRYAP